MATFYMHLQDGVEQSKPTYSVPYVDPFAEVGKYRPDNARIRSKTNVSKLWIQSYIAQNTHYDPYREWLLKII